MVLTKNAIGNLINRYKAVLKKCNLMNTFGSLAVAGMLVMGGAGVANAINVNPQDWTTSTNVVIDGDPDAIVDTAGNLMTPAGPAANLAFDKTKAAAAMTITGVDVDILGTTTLNGTATNMQEISIKAGGTLDTQVLNIFGATMDSRIFLDAADAVLNAGTINMSGGTITAGAADGTIVFDTFNLSGGELDVADDMSLAAKSGIATVNQTGADQSVLVDPGKTLTIGQGVTYNQGAGAVDNGGAIQVGFGNDGTVKIMGDAVFNNIGYTDNDSGATFHVYDGGALNITSGDFDNDGTIEIAFGGTFNATGGKLVNDGTVTINGAGYIGAGATIDNNGGTIEVIDDVAKEPAKLTVANQDKLDELLAHGTGTVDISGNAAGKGTLEVAGNVSLDAGQFAATSMPGKLAIRNNGVFKANELTLTKTGPANLTIDADGRIRAEKLFVTDDMKLAAGGIQVGNTLAALDTDNNSKTFIVGGTLTLGNSGTANGTIAGSVITENGVGGTINVNGNWALQNGATLIVNDGGALDIGEAPQPTILDVTSGNFKNLNSGATTTAGGPGVIIQKDGQLIVNRSQIWGSGTALDTTKMRNAIFVDGIVVVRNNALEDQNVVTMASSLIGAGDGLVYFKDGIEWQNPSSANAALLNANGNLVGTTGVPNTVEDSHVLFADKSVVVDNGTGTAGGFGAQTITVIRGTGGDTFAPSGPLTILGDGINLFINGDATTDVTAIQVDTGGALNLGSAAIAPSAQGGTFAGDVKLKDGTASLNVSTGNYTIGNVIADVPGNGDITITNGGKLLTGDIGATAAAVGTITADNGSVQASNIYADKISGGDGTGIVKATGDIKILGTTNGIAGDKGLLTVQGHNITVDANNITAGTGGVNVFAKNNLTVRDGEIDGSDGEMNIAVGNDMIIANPGTGTGELDMGKGGTLNVGGTADIASVAKLDGVDGRVNKMITHDELNIDTSASASDASHLSIGTLTPGNDITIGNAGNPNVKTMVAVQNITDGFHDNALNQSLQINDGAAMLYGPTGKYSDKSAEQIIAESRAVTGNALTGGAFATTRQLNIVLGSVGVGTGAGANPGEIQVTEGSVLAFDQRGVEATAHAGDRVKAVFKVATPTSEVADGASIYIANALYTNDSNHQLAVASDGTVDGTAPVNAANPEKVTVITDTDMLFGRLISQGSIINDVQDAADAYDGLDSELGGLIEDMYFGRKNDVYSSAGGIKFLSRATNKRYIDDTSDAAKVIEGAARLITIAGVPQMALAANNAAAGSIVSRTSIGSLNSSIISMDAKGNVSGGEKGANSGDELTGLFTGNGYDKTGLAMWIMPLWQSTNNFGMKTGNFNMDMSGNIGGIALGVDYTFEQAIRAGISFNIGGGYAEGSGDFASTENRMDFWGLGAYVSGAFNNFGVTADVNYTSTFNKIEQDLNDDMHMGNLKTDVRAYAISAGLRGEYKFQTSVLDILPHVAVRYTYLNTEDYDVKAGGTKIYKGDSLGQHIWTFPIGVQVSKDIALSNGWYVKPMLDLVVTPATGDIESKNDIRFTGVSGSATMETQIMDYITYGGQAGIEFGNDTMKFGVNYNVQLGEHTANHGVFGTFRYEF